MRDGTAWQEYKLMSDRIPVWIFALLVAWVSLPCAGAGSTEKKSVAYRWVDENGTVHYGDRVPPQYVQKESDILNSQGVQVGKLDAQKTPDQLAEDAREPRLEGFPGGVGRR